MLEFFVIGMVCAHVAQSGEAHCFQQDLAGPLPRSECWAIANSQELMSEMIDAMTREGHLVGEAWLICETRQVEPPALS